MEKKGRCLRAAQAHGGTTRRCPGQSAQTTRPRTARRATRLVQSLDQPPAHRRGLSGSGRGHRLARQPLGRRSAPGRTKIVPMVKVPSQQTPTARRQAPKKHPSPTSKFHPQPLRGWLGAWSVGFGVRNFASAFLTLSLVSPAAPNAFGATSPPTPETNSPGSVEYNVGDSAREDITTPIPLVVIDQEQTTALRQKRALRVPVICRYYTNVADQVESEFRSAFAETRSNFLNSVEASFPERFRDRKLEPSSLISPKFHRLTVSFQKQNKSFPVSTNLAALWAQGDSDRVLLASLAASLRELMAHPIRPDALPPDIKQLSFNVRLVSLPDRNAPLNLETALARGVNLRRTNIIALKRAKNELQEAFPA